MDLRGLFDGLYDKLVLRDLFGKVVPGLAFLLYAYSALLGHDAVDRLLNKMTVVLWVIVIGFAWLLSFALQFLGERCGMLKTYPSIRQKEKESLINRVKAAISILWKPPDERQGREDFYEKWAEFHEVAKPHERVYAERLSVIKEACGNGSVSIMLITVGLIYSLVKGKGDSHPPWQFSALAACLAISLWRMHIKHVKRYGEFVLSTTKPRENKRNEKDIPEKEKREALVENT